MKDLENLLALTFPTWNFEVIFGGNYISEKPFAEGVGVYLNAGINLGGGGGNIYLYHEGALPHEVAHEMGLNHHYDDFADYGKGTNMAPGETKCLMDITSSQLGSPDRFALDIQLDIDNGAKIKEIRKKINAHYPDDF